MVLQCRIKSEAIPSLPAALPQVKLSIALLRSSSVRSASNYSMVGGGSMTYSAVVATT